MVKTIPSIIFPVLFFLLLSAVFVYKLGYASLTSYDEAWYADITRNLIQSKNPFYLEFNDAKFIDHPPLGYMIMAVPAMLLGSNEFSTRLASALMGAGAVTIIFLIGKKLKNWQVGLGSAMILLSSMWFVLRVRSGNLDIQFIFWEVLTIWFLLSNHKNWLALASISFAALVMTKTLVWLGLLPLILYLLWKKQPTRKNLFKSVILFLALVIPWYAVNQLQDNNFLYHHFFEIGTKSRDNAYGLFAIQKNLQYLAIGIGKWYKPFIVALIFGCLQFLPIKPLRHKKTHELIFIFLWLSGFSIFLLSKNTEIWHLLPIYPAVALAIPLVLFNLLELNSLKSFLIITKPTLIIGIIFLAVFQFHQFSNLIYPKNIETLDEKDISIKAGKYEKIYLLDTFYPSAVYYSMSHIEPLHLDPDAYQKLGSLLSDEQNIFIINKNIKMMLDSDEVNYKIVEQNQSYFLISSGNEQSPR